jgi:hypothetical protein
MHIEFFPIGHLFYFELLLIATLFKRLKCTSLEIRSNGRMALENLEGGYPKCGVKQFRSLQSCSGCLSLSAWGWQRKVPEVVDRGEELALEPVHRAVVQAAVQAVRVEGRVELRAQASH